MNDFDTAHLSGKAQKFANDICKMIAKKNKAEPCGGGCKAFYTPDEFRRKAHRVPDEAILVLCYDGGDLRYYCNWSYADRTTTKKFNALLEKHGLKSENVDTVIDYVYER